MPMSRHKRRTLNFRVEKKRKRIKDRIKANLSQPRDAVPQEAVRLGVRDQFKNSPLGALSRSQRQQLTGRYIDISPAALKAGVHTKGITTGRMPKGSGANPKNLSPQALVNSGVRSIRGDKPKVQRFQRFAKGRKAHLLDEVSTLNEEMTSPYRKEGLPDKREFWIIKPESKLGKEMGLKKGDRPIFIPKSDPNPMSFTVKQGDKVLNKGRLK